MCATVVHQLKETNVNTERYVLTPRISKRRHALTMLEMLLVMAIIAIATLASCIHGYRLIQGMRYQAACERVEHRIEFCWILSCLANADFSLEFSENRGHLTLQIVTESPELDFVKNLLKDEIIEGIDSVRFFRSSNEELQPPYQLKFLHRMLMTPVESITLSSNSLDTNTTISLSKYHLTSSYSIERDTTIVPEEIRSYENSQTPPASP